MLIEQVLPYVIAEKSTLRDRLVAKATESGLSNEYIKSLIDAVPEPLICTDAFLDMLTGLWRYEFGVPYDIANSYYWGTHMWVPVDHLFAALCGAKSRLPAKKLTDYFARLSSPERHQAVLVEMIPAQKVDSSISLEFEVAGLGDGNHTVDWVIRPHSGRAILLDVKRRTTDFVAQAEDMTTGSSNQKPIHDPALLFRSIEQKFLPINPLTQLQGAWICTDIKQDEKKLAQAFSALCTERVHFAILGDWESDVHVLARREEDRQYLLNLFRVVSSNRFIFKDENND